MEKGAGKERCREVIGRIVDGGRQVTDGGWRMTDGGSGLRGKLPLRDEWLCAVLNVMLSGRVAVAAAWLRGVVCVVWPCCLAVVVRYAVGPGSSVM